MEKQQGVDLDWKGRVHVYTGDGKGKTTAALGLALRASGAGLKSFVVQFVKGMWYSELAALKKLEESITVVQVGRGCFISRTPAQEDIAVAKKGLQTAKEAIQSGKYRLVILDEANIALHFGLFAVDELIEIIQSRPANVEIVVTGRRACPELLELADLVTEMRQVRHYYEQGVQARTGIEK